MGVRLTIGGLTEVGVLLGELLPTVGAVSEACFNGLAAPRTDL